MFSERDPHGWLGRRQLIVAVLAAMSLVLFVAGIMPAGLFSLLAFVLATVWVWNWMRGFYYADRSERAEFASAFDRAQHSR